MVAWGQWLAVVVDYCQEVEVTGILLTCHASPPYAGNTPSASAVSCEI